MINSTQVDRSIEVKGVKELSQMICESPFDQSDLPQATKGNGFTPERSDNFLTS